jgi:hypothetical protein
MAWWELVFGARGSVNTPIVRDARLIPHQIGRAPKGEV